MTCAGRDDLLRADDDRIAAGGALSAGEALGREVDDRVRAALGGQSLKHLHRVRRRRRAPLHR